LRFNVTHEFEDFTLSDWLDNSKWFDVKLLVDPSGGRFEKAMTNDSYAKAIKAVLLGLGIAAIHLVHLGRNLGPKLLEMLEEESDAIRQLGNWNPSMQDSCYSTKLPMRPIRKLAGFVQANGMHYNPRTMVEVPEELARLTPIGGWAIDAFTNIEAAVSEQGLPKFTAYNVLKFLVELNRVFLQDAAAIMVNHPERVSHPLFRLEVFQTDEFLVSRDDSTIFLLHLSCLLTYLFKTFKNSISLAIADTGESPLDAKLEAVLPGVHQRLVANQREVVSLRTFVTTEFSNLGSQISEAFANQELAIQERDQQTGEAYLSLAQRLLGEGRSPNRPSPNRPRPTSLGVEATNSDDDGDNNSTTNTVMARPHSLVMKHKSLFTIYYEWYGLEHYVNTPVEGGIASLEARFKTKWRAHFSPAEKTYFSRLQKVIKGIQEQGRREAKEPDKILEEWDTLYQGEAKSSVTKMAMLVQSMGLVITRKARGKKHSNQQSA
jgi:hypothetical protein